jgi:hypothetical protein
MIPWFVFCLQSATNRALVELEQRITRFIMLGTLSCMPMTATPRELPRPIFRGNMTGKEE